MSRQQKDARGRGRGRGRPSNLARILNDGTARPLPFEGVASQSSRSTPNPAPTATKSNIGADNAVAGSSADGASNLRSLGRMISRPIQPNVEENARTPGTPRDKHDAVWTEFNLDFFYKIEAKVV